MSTISTHCAHCGHSQLAIPSIWLGLRGVAQYYYCSHTCWAAGPRSYGAAVQNRDLRGRPMPAFAVKASFLHRAAKSSICTAYQPEHSTLPVDSPAHVMAAKEGTGAIRRLLAA